VDWRVVKARLTPDAAAGWDRLCTRRNVTFTALMEALGEQLAAGTPAALDV
jgi:hypothetical protein